jgi:hypothetical protein
LVWRREDQLTYNFLKRCHKPKKSDNYCHKDVCICQRIERKEERPRSTKRMKELKDRKKKRMKMKTTKDIFIIQNVGHRFLPLERDREEPRFAGDLQVFVFHPSSLSSKGKKNGGEAVNQPDL